MYKIKWLSLYSIWYNEQDKIKYKKLFLTLNMYGCQTYIF